MKKEKRVIQVIIKKWSDHMGSAAFDLADRFVILQR